MRYDTPVFFQRITPGPYDASTGNYGPDQLQEDCRYASVMDTRTETLRLLFGKISQGSQTIQLQNHYYQPFDRIRIGDRLYSVDYRRRLRHKDVYIVSEVQ